MYSNSRDHIQRVFAALDANLDRACELSFDVLTTPELLRMAGRLEKMARRLPVPGHALINQLVHQATDDELGGNLTGGRFTPRSQYRTTSSTTHVSNVTRTMPSVPTRNVTTLCSCVSAE